MSKNRMKMIPGDLFELDTKKGKAYIQYVQEPLSNRELEKVKVFYSLYDKTPENLGDIIRGEFFFLKFILKVAFKDGLLKRVGNIPISRGFKYPTQFRTENPFGEGWNIIDTEVDKYIHTGLIDLTEEQKKLSPWGTWNDTLLIEKLEEGWRLENWI